MKPRITVAEGAAYVEYGEDSWLLEELLRDAIEAHIDATQSTESRDMAERLASLVEPLKHAVERPVFHYMVASRIPKWQAEDLSNILFRDD